jgi:hypothetical protein
MNVYGYFYNRTINDITINCRNILILSNSKINNITAFQADALIVMMNPGDSKPIDQTKIKLIDSTDELFNDFTNIFEAIADKTQDVIIELMNKMNYGNVIIINLSDIRNKNSSEFIKNIKGINFINTGSEHSIFDKSREKELSFVLDKCKNKPIIVATGMDYKLRFLTAQAMSSLPKDRIIGYKAEERYYHPSRMKNQWIQEVVGQL